MFRSVEPVIPFHAYPIAAGAHLGYGCFDGEKWVNCDKNGIPLVRKAYSSKKEGRK